MLLKKRKGAIWLFAIYFLLIQFAFTSLAFAQNSETNRIAGVDRYQTAVAISQKGWQASDYAVLARGDDFADALCAGPLAHKYAGPILLTEPQSLNVDTLAELKRLGVKHLFIVGGTGAIAQSVEDTLKAGGIATVERIYGATRYDTSVKIAEKLGNYEEAALVTGHDFPDALSISVIAAKLGMPILLTAKDTLPTSVSKLFQDQASITQTYVVGGTGVISTGLEGLVPNPTRLAGNDRYDTNIAILKYFEARFNFEMIYLAIGGGTHGNQFADALTGAVLAAKTSSPLVLVSGSLPKKTGDYLKTKLSFSSDVIALGGQAVVSSNVLSEVIACKEENSVSKYSTAGTYGPETGSETIQGNVKISAADVTLRNTIIEGDLLLAQSIGDGNVYLRDVTVKGKTIINGGGPNSIIMYNFNGVTVTVDVPEGSNVRLVAQGDTNIANITMESNGQLVESDLTGPGFVNITIPANVQVSLSGTFNEVNVQGSGAKVTVTSGAISTMTISETARGAEIGLAANTTVTTLNANANSNITGKGRISKANVRASNVIIVQTPTSTTVAVGITTSVGGKTLTGTNPSYSGGGGGSSSGGGGSPISVTAIKIAQVDQDLTMGATLQLTTTFTPANATNKNVTWASSADAIATVDANGKVTAVAEGEATITVTTADGDKTDGVVITVVKSVLVDVTTATITGIAKVGETLTASANDGATNLTYQWQIADTPDGPYANIDGATNTTLVLTEAHQGKFVRVVINGDNSSTVTSAETSAVVTASPVKEIVRELPALAYDTDKDRYLVAYKRGDREHTKAETGIYGRFVTLDGNFSGEEFVIAPSDSIAYDNKLKRFLVVWDDARDNATDGQWNVYGQFVSSDGSRAGEIFSISDITDVKEQTSPGIAFDRVNGNFIIIYNHQVDGNDQQGDLHCRLLKTDGTLGDDQKIAGGKWNQSGTSVDFNGTDFLVVYGDNGNKVKRIDSIGTPDTDAIIFTGDREGLEIPQLSYNVKLEEFLAVWSTRYVGTGSTWIDDICGSVVQKEGSTANPFVIVDQTKLKQFYPDVAAVGDKFAVVWMDAVSESSFNIRAAIVSADKKVSAPIVIAEDVGDYPSPTVCGSKDGALAAYEVQIGDDSNIKDIRVKKISLDSSSSIPVDSIAVTGADGATTIVSNKTLQMSVAVTPANATKQTVTWSVASGPGTISTDGLLTPTGVGVITVKATAQDNSGVEGTKEITVEADSSFFTFDPTTGTITGYNKEGGSDVVIPSMIDGVPVTSIGDGAFDAKDLLCVSIPNTVINIGADAFADNFLSDVTIPNSVTSIGRFAFSANKLIGVTIPNSLTIISDYAFSHNEVLASVTIPDSVEIIGEGAFSNNQLTTVTIPSSLKIIDNGAFYKNQIANLTIGDGVETIGESAFEGNQLTSIILPGSVKTINQGAFYGNQLTSITIGPGVEFEDILAISGPNTLSFKNAYVDGGAGHYVGTQEGTWTKQTSIEISTAEQLKAISGGLDKHYILANDIDLTDASANWMPLGYNLKKFTGTFDGNGKKITNFKLTTNNSVDPFGLFGATGENAVIKNVALESVKITSAYEPSALGGLVGNNGGTVSNSYVKGISFESADISGNYANIGGLVGVNSNSGKIFNSYSDVWVSCTSTQNPSSTGGLVGNNSGTIQNSYALGKTVGDHSVGGLVGTNGSLGIIKDSYATGEVIASYDVGGLVGSNLGGTIENSYATGDVYGKLEGVGGLIGSTTGGAIRNSEARNGRIYNMLQGASSSPNLYGRIVGKLDNTPTLEGNYATDNMGYSYYNKVDGKWIQTPRDDYFSTDIENIGVDKRHGGNLSTKP